MPVQLFLNDAVLLYTNRDIKPHSTDQGIGLIRYIGYIDGCGMSEQIGIELIEPIKTGHDGKINNYQYFRCTKGHGVNVKLIHIIKKLTPEEIISKLRDVIGMFKIKLDEYGKAVKERDEYIEELKDKNTILRKENILLKKQNNNNKNNDNNDNNGNNNHNNGNGGGKYNNTLKVIEDDSELDLTTPLHDDNNGLIMSKMVQKFDISRRTSFVASNPITPITPADLISHDARTLTTGTPGSRKTSTIFQEPPLNMIEEEEEKVSENNKLQKLNKIRNQLKKNKKQKILTTRHAISQSISKGQFPDLFDLNKSDIDNEYNDNENDNNDDDNSKSKSIKSRNSKHNDLKENDIDTDSQSDDTVQQGLLMNTNSVSNRSSKSSHLGLGLKKRASNNGKFLSNSHPNTGRQQKNTQQVNNNTNYEILQPHQIGLINNQQIFYGINNGQPNQQYIQQISQNKRPSLPLMYAQQQQQQQQQQTTQQYFKQSPNQLIDDNNQVPMGIYRPKTHAPIIQYDIPSTQKQQKQRYKQQQQPFGMQVQQSGPIILNAPINQMDDDDDNNDDYNNYNNDYFIKKSNHMNNQPNVVRAQSFNKLLGSRNNPYSIEDDDNNNGHWNKVFGQVPQIDKWVNSQSTRESKYSRQQRTKKILKQKKQINNNNQMYGRPVNTPQSARMRDQIQVNPYIDESFINNGIEYYNPYINQNIVNSNIYNNNNNNNNTNINNNKNMNNYTDHHQMKIISKRKKKKNRPLSQQFVVKGQEIQYKYIDDQQYYNNQMSKNRKKNKIKHHEY